MTREQAKQKLIGFGVAEPSEQQVTEYLNSISEETKAAEDKAAKLKEKAEKAEKLQKELDDLQEKDLTETERVAKELEEANEKIAELTSNNFRAEAKAILSAKGITDDDMKDLLPGLVGGSIEETQARANAFVSAMEKRTEEAIKAKEKELLNSTSKPGGNSGDGDDNKTAAQKFAESTFVSKKADGDAKSETESIIGNYK